jgi:hypothetical protein
MNDRVCAFENRDEAIVGYLYDDMDPGARRAFEDHVVGCLACSTEIAVLRDVRGDLARWTPPGPARVLTFDPALRRRARVWAALADVPTWVQVAAALVILGISLRADRCHGGGSMGAYDQAVLLTYLQQVPTFGACTEPELEHLLGEPLEL